MSSIVLSPGATGAAAFTIEAPSTATSRVITLPDATDTLVGKATTDTLTNKSIAATQLTGSVAVANGGTGLTALGPAFSAKPSSNQTITNNTTTLVTLGTENFDTNSNFASSRFTPTVAGYYQFDLTVTEEMAANKDVLTIGLLYKNGAEEMRSVDSGNMGAAGERSCSFSVVLSMNGSSDYVEMYIYHADFTSTGSGTLKAIASRFSGALIRGA